MRRRNAIAGASARGGLLGRVDIFARGLIPILSLAFLTFLAAVPLRLPDIELLTPAWTLMAIYYWAIYRPELTPAIAVFGIGLLKDLLAGGHLGLTAFTLLIVYGLVVSQRKFLHGKSFGVVWWGFMLVAAGAALLKWIVASILAGWPIDPRAQVFSVLLTIALYPPVVLGLSQIHKAAPPQAGTE